MTPYGFIRKNKINMNLLAERMNMPASTFIHKIHVNRKEYHLRKEEHEKLLSVLNTIGSDIVQYVREQKKKIAKSKNK